MRITFSFLVLSLPVAVCASDQHVETRECFDDFLQKRVAITTIIKSEKPKPGVVSPNNDYFFVFEGKPGDPERKVTIFVEKGHHTQIKFTELIGFSGPEWISGKRLLLRPWWGRLVGTDIIFDVEKEIVLYAKTVHFGEAQDINYSDNCPQHSCECIQIQ